MGLRQLKISVVHRVGGVTAIADLLPFAVALRVDAREAGELPS